MENVEANAILSEEAVKAALEADKGKDAKLDFWKIVPFTKKGDNYASYVTGISVNYSKGDKKEITSYVAKMNPCRRYLNSRPSFDESLPDSPDFFRKEGKFYMDLLPELNHLLTKSGHSRVPFPECYYAQYTEGKELIIFEDLRLKGFKMLDRQKGMDLQHAILVMQGLGRLHGASILMQNNLSMDDIKMKFPFLFEEIWRGQMIESEFSDSTKTAANILEQIGGYEKPAKLLNEITPNLIDFFTKSYAISPPFSVVCHGDCWINNILFRYNDSGIPVEVMLLDVQLNRIASPATDLVHFMFASLVGDVRKPNLDRLLTDYFASFSSAIEGSGKEIPYTKEELVKEYKSKFLYGLIFGSNVIPTLLLEGEDLPDMENISPENLDQFTEDWNKLVLATFNKTPAAKTRFIAMFDEMLEEGLFS